LTNAGLHVSTHSCKIIQHAGGTKAVTGRTSTPEERRAFVLRKLAEVGRIATSDLSAYFQISEDSARRDFREMAAEGLIQRVHGAALAASPAGRPFFARNRIAADAKTQLARKAAQLVTIGQTVLFDGGTTNVAIAQQLPLTLPLTVVTNSPPVATALMGHPLVEIILFGGVFDKLSQMTLGANVLEAVSNINADICFFGVHAIDCSAGLTTAGFDEASVKRAMIKSSAEIVAVATADKLGTAAAHRIGPTSAITCLITEKTANPAQIAAIRSLGTIVDLV
jgi:DeoR/GlpR family transcriptional regulator of sugar metabolism